MARKGWNALSAAYRTRLEKAGITKTDYESGASIRKARGHLHTPERPTSKNAHTFRNYQLTRAQLTQRVLEKKHYYFSEGPIWNPRRAMQKFASDPPAMDVLRKWARMNKEEWLREIRQEPDYIAYLGYH